MDGWISVLFLRRQGQMFSSAHSFLLIFGKRGWCECSSFISLCWFVFCRTGTGKNHYSELFIHIFMIHLIAHLHIIGHCPVGQAPTALQYEASWKGVFFFFFFSFHRSTCLWKNKFQCLLLLGWSFSLSETLTWPLTKEAKQETLVGRRQSRSVENRQWKEQEGCDWHDNS